MVEELLVEYCFLIVVKDEFGVVDAVVGSSDLMVARIVDLFLLLG